MWIRVGECGSELVNVDIRVDRISWVIMGKYVGQSGSEWVKTNKSEWIRVSRSQSVWTGIG